MSAPLSMREREKQLQVLLPTPAGKLQLEELAAHYGATSGKMMPERTSLITYILVYEREHGMIAG